MNRIFTTVLVVSVLDCIGNNGYKVEGKLNQSCVTSHDSCSVCCANSRCQNNYDFPNACTDGCIDGHRGARCYELCDLPCKSCESSRSYCDSCFNGFFPGPERNCKSKCPSNCKTCTSDTNCQICKDGFFNKDGSTDCRYSICPRNCLCNYSECIMCKPGFYDINHSCAYKCPINCLNCSTFTDCSSCKDGFYIDDDKKTCSNKCIEDCINCSSYDKCLKCQTGKFGHQCQNNCSIGCTTNDCLIETGKCVCLSNFTGETCSDCLNGQYGTWCDKKCPDNCVDKTCERTQGNCAKGCNSGKYDLFCENNCPKNCLNEKCDNNNGTCTDGCNEGFAGQKCTECVPGKYGHDCQDECLDSCLYRKCNKTSGDCIECMGNFYGAECDICKPGYYGLNCEQTCSSFCAEDICDRHEGTCTNGCKGNYSGNKCCIANNCLVCASNTKCLKCTTGFYSESCENRCPENCVDTCNFVTGVCYECKANFYGPYCSSMCSENCVTILDSNISSCTKSDGRCYLGCTTGIYGNACRKKCSRLCKDNVCEQETGICTKGCVDSSNENFVCLGSVGKIQDEKKDDSSKVSTIVLGTLLAVTAIALCVSISKEIMKKLFNTKCRRLKESVIPNDLDHITMEMQNMSNEDEACREENVAYESLDETRYYEDTCISEHEKYINLVMVPRLET